MSGSVLSAGTAQRRSRSEWAREFFALRRQGWTGLAIAREFGCGSAFVYDVLNDPEGAKAKARRDTYRGVCERCGAPTDGSNGRDKAPPVCASCAPLVYDFGASRRGKGPVTARTLAFLSEPHRFSEIRDYLGVSNGYASSHLHRLVRFGLVRRVSRGVYVAAARD